jgi:hypothetical protein
MLRFKRIHSSLAWCVLAIPAIALTAVGCGSKDVGSEGIPVSKEQVEQAKNEPASSDATEKKDPADAGPPPNLR